MPCNRDLERRLADAEQKVAEAERRLREAAIFTKNLQLAEKVRQQLTKVMLPRHTRFCQQLDALAMQTII